MPEITIYLSFNPPFMYREADLTDCLYGLAGWRQNQNPELETLPPSLIATLSGLYYQDAHPLLTLENLDQALKNYDAFVYPAYTTAAAYVIGDRVRYATDGKVYEALANVAVAPAILEPADWVEIKQFSQKIEALTRASINKVATSMFTAKKLDGVAKSIFESVKLFGGVGDLMNKEVKSGRFVGLEIRLKNSSDIAVNIRRIGTQFSLANPAFKLWVFSPDQEAYVTSRDMNISSANAFAWADIDILLTSPVSYIGYYEDNLVGNAINKAYNWGAVPQCGTCNNDLALYAQWTQFVEVTPFYVPSSYLVGKLPGDPGGPLLWDVNVNQYSLSKNFGLNLDLSVGCDVTDFLCRERRLFTDAVTKQVAVDVLNELAYNTRNNVISRETRELAMYALNGKENSDNMPGKLEKAIKALSFDFSDLNSACLPCDNRNGTSWGTF
jgi:hypothetical protein